ncbi:hypothetical protein OHB06_50160 [Streptomyces sp. NBC_01604]|uniref:hypothetical protein n=1 Tax=Streptomyces sp. NBC_01604 TaxID=2975894 RepID=UPI00386A76DA
MAAVCAALATAAGTSAELVVWLPPAIVDFAAHQLPDVGTLPLAAAALVLQAVAAPLPEAGWQRCSNRLKQWRGIAIRYEKTAPIYLAGLHVAGIVLRSGR